MSAFIGVVVATCIALAVLVAGWPMLVSHTVGRRAPEGVARREVRWPILTGAAALGLVAMAVRFGHSAAGGAVLGTSIASQGLGQVTAGRIIALVLPGLTDPRLLLGL